MREVYLDNAATTRCNPQVARLALELMTEDYGNPSSLHRKGFEAQRRLRAARRQLAEALGCREEEVIFTSGGTEANNLAIQGAVAARLRLGKTLVAMATAHASVLEPLRYLEKQGHTLRLVPPLPDGSADEAALLEAVDGDTVLFCSQLVDSEVGTVAPVAGLSRAIRRKNKNVYLHCDAVQGLGKTAFSAARLGVDSLSVSAHKIAAPKGCGALYLRRGARILPLCYGGGQEGGLRPGTESTPLACAFGEAAALALGNMEENSAHVKELREYFVNKLVKIPGVCMNSPPQATPYICNLSVPGYRSETMLHFLAERGIYVSSGSACSKGAASHVLKAMGLPPERVDSALRVSFCPRNTKEEIDVLCEALGEGMAALARSGKGK